MALLAEQDNCVKTANGTAAVYTELILRRKSVTGETSGKARIGAWDIPPTMCESEDLRIGFSPCLRVYGQVRLSQKNGCGALYECRSHIVF